MMRYLDVGVVQKLLKNAVGYIGPEVVHLTSSSDIVKHAFSIVCSATNVYYIVVLSGDFSMCMQTSCRPNNYHKRKIDTLMTDNSTSCPHLECMKRNHQIWECFLNTAKDTIKKKHTKACIFLSFCKTYNL